MNDLDDPGSLAAVDPHDALGAVERIPEQWLEAITRARSCEGLPTRHGINGIVYCGMGGSGLACAGRGIGGRCSTTRDVAGSFIGVFAGSAQMTIACTDSASSNGPSGATPMSSREVLSVSRMRVIV